MLQRLPVRQQLFLMKLRPRQNEALPTSRKGTSQKLDPVDISDAHVVLIVRGEVRHMMLSSGLNEHTNDNSEEPRNLWHHPSSP